MRPLPVKHTLFFLFDFRENVRELSEANEYKLHLPHAERVRQCAILFRRMD